MKATLYLLILVTLLSSKSLEEYAKELPKASFPGEHIREFVLKNGMELAPDKRVAKIYRKLLKEWKYRNDPPGYDHFSISEELMKRENLEGDCEDFASVLVSVCRVMNLKCQVALGIRGRAGHAWTEVFITDDKILNRKLYFRIKREFGDNAKLVYRSDGFWLQLNPENTIKQYRTSHTIDLNGNLIEIIHREYSQEK